MYFCSKCKHRPTGNEWMLVNECCGVVICINCCLRSLAKTVPTCANCNKVLQAVPKVTEEDNKFIIQRTNTSVYKPKTTYIYATLSDTARDFFSEKGDVLTTMIFASFFVPSDRLMFYSMAVGSYIIGSTITLWYKPTDIITNTFKCTICGTANEIFLVSSACKHLMCFTCASSFNYRECPNCLRHIDQTDDITVTDTTVTIMVAQTRFVKNVPESFVDTPSATNQCLICLTNAAICVGPCGCQSVCVDCARRLETLPKCPRCNQHLTHMSFLRLLQ